MKYLYSNSTSVNDTSKLLEDISSLYLSEQFSDITLIVGAEEFRAHKVILAARSSYFSSLLYNNLGKEIDQTQLELDVPPKAIREVLSFLYTGNITISLTNIESALEILSVASRCNLSNLETNLVQKIKTLLSLKNVCAVLNVATLYDLENLREGCLNFMDQHASEIISEDCINDLSQKSLIKLLERDTFFAPELKIFKGVEKWCKNNNDVDDLVVKTVRLSCLSVADVVSVVWSSKLVKCEDLLEAIAEIVDVKPIKYLPRAKWIKNVNVATSEFKTAIITGKNTNNLLTGNRNVEIYAECLIGDKNGFTVKFGFPVVINCIHTMLWDKDKRSYKYYIEGSHYGKKWKKIIDYSTYPCRSEQKVFFQKEVVQYVRVVGIHNTENAFFHLVYFEAYYTDSIPKLINNIICPNENVASVEKKAIVIEGINGEALINGVTTNYGNYCKHVIGKESIVIELAQPYMLSNMRLLLWDEDERSYKYFIEISINKSDWTIVADNRNKESKSWQIHKFGERPVVFIKITGTSNTANNEFHLMHFECPSTV